MILLGDSDTEARRRAIKYQRMHILSSKSARVAISLSERRKQTHTGKIVQVALLHQHTPEDVGADPAKAPLTVPLLLLIRSCGLKMSAVATGTNTAGKQSFRTTATEFE